MTDSDLRRLERQFRETGAPEDGAALIVEHLRAGADIEGLVQIAAMCGDPAAELVFPRLRQLPQQEWSATADRLPAALRATIALWIGEGLFSELRRVPVLSAEDLQAWEAARSVATKMLDFSFSTTNEDHVHERALVKTLFLGPVDQAGRTGMAENALRAVFRWVIGPEALEPAEIRLVVETAVAFSSAISGGATHQESFQRMRMRLRSLAVASVRTRLGLEAASAEST